jgi:hypothetical protein
MVSHTISRTMTRGIDHSVYPDLDNPPEEFVDDFQRADYVQRVCTAWDFGIMPRPETFDLLAGWKQIFDQFPVVTSPAYHAMRERFGWQPIPWPNGIAPPMAPWEHMDRIEQRPPDPCEKMI